MIKKIPEQKGQPRWKIPPRLLSVSLAAKHLRFLSIRENWKKFGCDNYFAFPNDSGRTEFSCPHCTKQYRNDNFYNHSFTGASIVTCPSPSCNVNPLSPVHIFFPIQLIFTILKHQDNPFIYCPKCQKGKNIIWLFVKA